MFPGFLRLSQAMRAFLHLMVAVTRTAQPEEAIRRKAGTIEGAAFAFLPGDWDAGEIHWDSARFGYAHFYPTNRNLSSFVFVAVAIRELPMLGAFEVDTRAGETLIFARRSR